VCKVHRALRAISLAPMLSGELSSSAARFELLVNCRLIPEQVEAHLLTVEVVDALPFPYSEAPESRVSPQLLD
jgi:hypothetical protein